MSKIKGKTPGQIIPNAKVNVMGAPEVGASINNMPGPTGGGINRRGALQQIGLGIGAMAIGCTSTGTDPDGGADAARDGALPGVDLGRPDLSPDLGPEPVLSREELLGSVDHIIVLMMENRSFDHYLGNLKHDLLYPAAAVVDGLTLNETNLDPQGKPVKVFRSNSFTSADPPHEWNDCRKQWDGGKNDGFVLSHAGPEQNEVMGYHDRTQLPFYYSLADRFTVFDRYFASVLGPTWPNRYYLHACTANGAMAGPPPLLKEPTTLWELMKKKGFSATNYAAGQVAWFTGAFPIKRLTQNPVADISAFFKDAKNGTLPNFAVIDPDFEMTDDHPPHDIQLGEAFISSVVHAIAQSPQWSRILLLLTYDEHGGFFDHVPPPTTTDDNPDYRQLGFRVPAIAIGPTVRRGKINHDRFDHVSVAATLALRFGIGSLNARMDATADLSSCIDPRLVGHPTPPPQLLDLPQVVLSRQAVDLAVAQAHATQPELYAMVKSGQIPRRFVDPRSTAERTALWLAEAERLGAVRVID